MDTERQIEQRNGEAHVAEEEELERLRVKMEAKRTTVPDPVSEYVQATLEFGVAQTRYEYRGFAQRNYAEIQKLGKRLMRMFAVLIVVLLGLGYLSYHTTLEIQSGREDSVLEKCHSGERFDRKLRAEIKGLPEPKKAEAEAQLKFTEELVSTVVPIGDCDSALRKAGLR